MSIEGYGEGADAGIEFSINERLIGQ